MTTLHIQTESIPIKIEIPTITSMSDAEFRKLCLANRNLRIERTGNGEVIIMPPVHSETGHRNFNLAVQLGNWADQDGCGLGFDSSTGFTLPNGAIRSPDASWIKLERWNTLTEEQKASFAPICPDFVIELRSASDTLKDLQNKMQEYISNGALLGWLIDRKNSTVSIYRPNQEPEILNAPETVSGNPELPGFILRMGKIW